MPTRREIQIYEQAGAIITWANNQLEALEELGLTDVYEYLSAQERADNLLLQFETGLEGKTNHLKDALSIWESDRSKSLYLLLLLAKHSVELKRFQTAQSCVRCARALVESPLIPTLDLEAYGHMHDHVEILLEKENKNRNVRSISNAYYAGVTYNCVAFATGIFTDEVTEGTIKAARADYYQMLNILQGRPAVMHWMRQIRYSFVIKGQLLQHEYLLSTSKNTFAACYVHEQSELNVAGVARIMSKSSQIYPG